MPNLSLKDFLSIFGKPAAKKVVSQIFGTKEGERLEPVTSKVTNIVANAIDDNGHVDKSKLTSSVEAAIIEGIAEKVPDVESAIGKHIKDHVKDPAIAAALINDIHSSLSLLGASS